MKKSVKGVLSVNCYKSTDYGYTVIFHVDDKMEWLKSILKHEDLTYNFLLNGTGVPEYYIAV
jgi:hypothetical protein